MRKRKRGRRSVPQYLLVNQIPAHGVKEEETRGGAEGEGQEVAEGEPLEGSDPAVGG